MSCFSFLCPEAARIAFETQKSDSDSLNNNFNVAFSDCGNIAAPFPCYATFFFFKTTGGSGGIRTPGGLLPSCFRNRCLQPLGHASSYKHNHKPGGSGGIRTLGGLLPSRFQDGRLQPLGHTSILVDRAGFEPAKPEAGDLQSPGFDLSPTDPGDYI